jgi:hypothetical protein
MLVSIKMDICFIKGRKYVDQMSDPQLLRKDWILWS